MTDRGFTIVELLVALTVLLAVSAAAFALVRPIQAAFDAQPAVIDVRQRTRVGLEVIGRTVLNAGGDSTGSPARPLASMLPVLWPLSALDGLDAGPGLHAVWSLAAVAGGGRGRLAEDQAGAAGPLRLSADGCPLVSVVCGFTAGAVVAVVDDRGRFDIFEAGTLDAVSRRISPLSPLARAYLAGAWLIEIEADWLGLRREPDGSHTLVRTTWSGSIEPIVDGVVSMDLRVLGAASPPSLEEPAASDPTGLASYGPPPVAAASADPDAWWPDGEHCTATRDAAGMRSRLAPWGGAADLVEVRAADLLDGPWCPNPDAAGAYDADLFRIRQVDLVLRLEASGRFRGAAGALFARAGHADASRWIPDREMVLTVARR